MKHQGIVLILSSLLFVGCGAQEAIDATKSVPDRLDKTHKQIEETHSAIEKTNEVIRQQKLLVALDDMFKDRNTTYTTPPTGMLAGGKAFAEEATTEELAELTYVWMTEVKKGLPDGEMDDAAKAQARKDKNVKLLALQVIAALTPQKKVEKLIKEQFEEGGRYRDEVYEFLMARAIFLHGFMLTESLLSPDQILDTPGKLEESIERIEHLEYLTSLPFAKKIGIDVKASAVDFEAQIGLADLDWEYEFELTKPLWEKVKLGFEKQLDPKYKNDPLVQSLKQKVDPYFKKWKLN